MTTLVGVTAEKGKKGIILASDLSRTRTSWRPHGDVAFRQQTRSEGQKIYIDNEGEFAVCMSGVFDQSYVDFLSELLEGNTDLIKNIPEGKFYELLRLNLSRWEGRIPNEDMNSLLFATRFNGKPELYTCYPLGNIERRIYTSIGSGSGYALENISSSTELIPKGITLKKGVDLVVQSLEKASQDIYTGGLDLVVVTKNGIQSFGKDIKESIDNAKSYAIRDIKKKL